MSIHKFPSFCLSMAVIPFVIVCSKAQPVEVKIQTQNCEQGSSLSQVASSATKQTLQEIQAKEEFQTHQKAAGKGNPKEQFNFGECYLRGLGVGTNYYEAATWFRKAAEQGDAKSQCQLGLLYQRGQGVETNYDEAIKWIRKAVEQGDVEAQFALGHSYCQGRGVETNGAEGIKWFRKSAEGGHAEAQALLGSMYRYGREVGKDYDEAIKWLSKSAAQGNAYAQSNLGHAYREGNGVETNLAESVKWYRKAAEQGYANAQVWLAICYRDGQGVGLDLNEAEKWFRKAAVLGDEYGKREILKLAFEAELAETAKEVRKLADEGYVYMQLTLAKLYRDGRGVRKSSEEAFKWFYKAATQGNADAQLELGFCYSNGDGVEENRVDAARWYQKAAEQGHSTAQACLGARYERGDGVIKDLEQAYGWYLLSSAGGHYKSDDLLSFEKKLSPAEQRNARIWAKNWKPQGRYSKFFQSEGTNFSQGIDSEWTSTGSGFFISDKGYFITAHHVVSGATRIVLNTSGGAFDAKIIAADKVNDVAILKVWSSATRPFAALTIPTRCKVTLGQSVFTVGFPNPSLQGINPKLTKGEISALTGIGDDIRAYQISIPVQSGNSGGVLADEFANVLGIVVQKLNTLGVALVTGDVPQNVNYALKVSYANSLIDSVPGLSESLPQPSGDALSFEKAVQKVQAASALVLSFGQKPE